MIFFGVDKGLLFGIVILLLALVYRNSKPELIPVSRYDDSELFIEQKNGEKDSSAVFLKFNGPLNFVSAGNFTLKGTRIGSEFRLSLRHFLFNTGAYKARN